MSSRLAYAIFSASGKWALWALLALFGVTILRFTIGDLLSASNPAASLKFDPSEAGARVELAQRWLVEDATRYDDAVAAARRALNDNPFALGAVTLLARADESKGDRVGAAALMELASRMDRRDLRSELWLLDQDLRNARVASALARVDILLRGQQPEVIDRLTPPFAALVVSEPYLQGFAALLRANPPWRSYWLNQLIQRSDAPTRLNALLIALQTEQNPPTESELRAFLTRLVSAGLWDEAYVAWKASLPAPRAGEGELLYNAAFHYPLTDQPFDWVFLRTPEALVEVETQGERRVLNVDFFGARIIFRHVSHVLKLPPGAYRFTGLERSRKLENERGLRWRISCAERDDAVLGTSELLSGDVDWRPFDFEFSVPPDQCAFQRLVLELPARVALETEIVGGVSYADLDIRSK